MENNTQLYNAVINGCIGTLHAYEGDSYSDLVDGVSGLAAAVDAMIDPIEGGPSAAEVNLLQEIVQVKSTSIDWFQTGYYAALPFQIVSMWQDLRLKLKS